jgi:pSer/pThr/pTyr-binding forkhead associated (FHA) protein
MLYEAVTGQRPYPIRSIFDAAKFHSSGQLTAPRAHNPAIPKKLDVLIQRMLAPGLDERVSSAADVVDALQELLDMLGEDAASLERSKLLRERILSEGVTGEPPEAVVAPSTPTATPAAKKAQQFYIQVAYEGVVEERVYPLGDRSSIIGRLPSSDIVLDRPGQRYVSKRHCEVLVRDNRVLIRDLGSTNGTVLGQEALQINMFREWGVDERVLLGPFVLSLRTDEELEALPSPPSMNSAAPSSGLPTTKVHDAPKLSCANAVPSRMPVGASKPVLIGRSIECDMVIDHPHVSKKHCRIQLTENGVEVTDLRSTNGTFLGDQRLPPHVAVPWKDLPTIRVGPFEIALERKSE